MKNERIRNWAHIAEIISGIAVLITLVFLVLEIRGNSDLIRANTFNRSIESLIDYRMQIASNENSLRVMTEHWGIDNAELLRHQLLAVNLWSIYEKTYFSRQYGLVGPAEWERFESRICGYVRRESGLDFWKDNVAKFMTDEFRNYVASRCEVADKGTKVAIAGADNALAENQSPYAGEESRSIKSLSAKEIKSLRNGAGMGFAKLAELNHFPGPKHVLAIADDLDLSSSQLASTESLYNEMRSRAMELGEQLIEAETRLDMKFKDASINRDLLEQALLDIGRLRARLRYVHLETHLRQRRVLTDEQVEKYDAIRGY